MTDKITDLAAKRVITAALHQTVGHARGVMERHRNRSVPLVGTDNERIGIVTTADLARRVKDVSPVSRIMSRDATAVAAYKDMSIAARVMRKRKAHHVAVTSGKKTIGLISSFDPLKLVEGRRCVAMDAPTQAKTSKRGRKAR